MLGVSDPAYRLTDQDHQTLKSESNWIFGAILSNAAKDVIKFGDGPAVEGQMVRAAHRFLSEEILAAINALCTHPDDKVMRLELYTFISEA